MLKLCKGCSNWLQNENRARRHRLALPGYGGVYKIIRIDPPKTNVNRRDTQNAKVPKQSESYFKPEQRSGTSWKWQRVNQASRELIRHESEKPTFGGGSSMQIK